MNDSDNLKVKRNLTALVEFSRIINASLDLDFILNNILLTCLGKFLATKGLIAVNIEGQLSVKSIKGITQDIVKNFPKIKANKNITENEQFLEFLKNSNLQTVEKISSSEECIGIICLGEKLNKAPFSEDDVEFLRTILNISASAIQNSMVVDELKKVNRVLDSRIQRLNSLFELSKEFGTITEKSRVAKLLVYSVIGQFLVSKFAVVTFNESGTKILESKFSENELLTALQCYDVKKITNSSNSNLIKEQYPELHRLGFKLLVPMQIQGATKGLILLGTRINKMKYSEADIEFIYSVGSLAIISLENQRLFIEELEKQKMEEELEIARDIQRNLLPHSIPRYKNFEIAAENLSSKQVGGDYYDVIKLDEDSFCIAIADVSGKGVPAALLMANIQAFLKTFSKQGMDLEEATGLINDLITENVSDGKFITFFWGVLEEDKKTIHYVNAGHNQPLLIRNNEIRKLDKGGIILGVMKTQVPYESESVQLEKDDVVILFTDGITEAKNLSDEEFSDERLEELAKHFANNSAPEILSSIQKEIKRFTKGALQSDDITLIVLKVK